MTPALSAETKPKSDASMHPGELPLPTLYLRLGSAPAAVGQDDDPDAGQEDEDQTAGDAHHRLP